MSVITLQSDSIGRLILTARELARADLSFDTEYIDSEHNRDSVLLRTHTVVFGRRGSGKTALLKELRRVTAGRNCVIWLDADEYKTLAFPDTLIQLFRAISSELLSNLRPKWYEFWRRTERKLVKELKSYHAGFTELLGEFDRSEVTYSRETEQKTTEGAKLEASYRNLSAGVSADQSDADKRVRSTRGVEQKIQLIDRRLHDFRNAVSSGVIHPVGALSRASLARPTLSMISSAVFLQMNGFGSLLCWSM